MGTAYYILKTLLSLLLNVGVPVITYFKGKKIQRLTTNNATLKEENRRLKDAQKIDKHISDMSDDELNSFLSE